MNFNPDVKVNKPYCTLKVITDGVWLTYLDGRPDLMLFSKDYLVVDCLIETHTLEVE